MIAAQTAAQAGVNFLQANQRLELLEAVRAEDELSSEEAVK
jgi:hypothetical protein